MSKFVNVVMCKFEDEFNFSKLIFGFDAMNPFSRLA